MHFVEWTHLCELIYVEGASFVNGFLDDYERLNDARGKQKHKANLKELHTRTQIRPNGKLRELEILESNLHK